MMGRAFDNAIKEHEEREKKKSEQKKSEQKKSTNGNMPNDIDDTDTNI